METKLSGRWGEAMAAEYLKKKGYEIIGLNYGCRHGEIDLIAGYMRFVVFVEVKLRKNADFAEAREFVTRSKQKKIITAALSWLALNTGFSEHQPRFDVIEVYASRGASGGDVKINHIENAFGQE